MFNKRNENELELPPIAKSSPDAVEVLRVWAEPGRPQQLTLKTTWANPGAWGLLLADVARHASKAYEREGINSAEALSRIKQFLDSEFARSTSSADSLN